MVSSIELLDIFELHYIIKVGSCISPHIFTVFIDEKSGLSTDHFTLQKFNWPILAASLGSMITFVDDIVRVVEGGPIYVFVSSINSLGKTSLTCVMFR